MKDIVDIDVNTGEVKVSREKVRLRSIAIGSCIVISAYDSRNKTGALAHIMLPGSAPEKSSEKTKYAADGINEMLNRMIWAGSKKSDIEVCLVGGGNVLKKQDDTICQDNIASTTQLLEQKHIPIRATVLGGTRRKSVMLDVQSGDTFYTEGDGKEELLWKPAAKSP